MDKHVPIVDFAINNSIHSSTVKTPFYVNGLRHLRTPVSFVRIPSLSGRGHLSTLGENAEEHDFSPMLWWKLALVTLPVPQWSRHKLSVIQCNNDAYLLVVSLDAKSVIEAKRFVGKRLATTHNVCEAMTSAQDNRKNMQTK